MADHPLRNVFFERRAGFGWGKRRRGGGEAGDEGMAASRFSSTEKGEVSGMKKQGGYEGKKGRELTKREGGKSNIYTIIRGGLQEGKGIEKKSPV